MVKNQPCKAGNEGLIPGQGTKIPYALGQLSPCSTTRDLVNHKVKSHMMQQRLCLLKLRLFFFFVVDFVIH